MLFSIVGAIISALGLISGIIVGVSTDNILFTLLVWTGSFLFAIIFFGMGKILKNQERILCIINPKESNNGSLDTKSIATKSTNEPQTIEPESKHVPNNFDINQLSVEQVAQIQMLIKHYEKYEAAKKLSEFTGMSFGEAIEAINYF